MRSLFSPFFQDHFKREFLTDEHSLIAIDTNYLTSIVRLAPDAAQKYINTLKFYKKNIYIPYIVALEFNFNKCKVKREKHLALKNSKGHIDDLEKDTKDKIDGIIKIVSSEQGERIKKETNDYIDKIRNEMSNDKIKNIEKREIKIYNSLIKEIDNKIGEKPTQELISEIQEQGKKRYEEEFPPGYNDQDKGEKTRKFDGLEYEEKYGDLLIWKDIIKKAKSISAKRVIFVTDDGTSNKKHDLYYEVSHQKIGPRIELMDELYRETHSKLYIVRNQRFVETYSSLDEGDKQQIQNLYFQPKNNYNRKYHDIEYGLANANDKKALIDEIMFKLALIDQQINELKNRENRLINVVAHKGASFNSGYFNKSIDDYEEELLIKKRAKKAWENRLKTVLGNDDDSSEDEPDDPTLL